MKVGLALSGGAARCIAQIGVLEVLAREGIPINAVSGTSAGGVIGALYCSGDFSVPELKEWALGLGRKTWRRILKPNLPKRIGWIDSEKISRYLSGLIRDKKFHELKIPLVVMATNLRSGEKVPLTTGSVARAVQASCSLPVVFTPTEIDGTVLIDGGASSQLPVLAVTEVLGADFTIAVDVNCNAGESTRLDNIFQIAIHFVSLFARRNATAEKKYADVTIDVDATGIALYDLDKTGLLLARGRKAAESKIAEIKEKVMRQRRERR